MSILHALCVAKCDSDSAVRDLIAAYVETTKYNDVADKWKPSARLVCTFPCEHPEDVAVMVIDAAWAPSL